MLSFSNASRYFDESRNCVCFWGYDSTIEVSFFVAAEALQLLCPEMEKVESGFLQAFDNALGRIHKVADKVYSHGGKGKGSYAYTLAAEDF
ncbi:MAG: DUF1488 domain-containing protein [Gammaproteobacteria bacterium]|jgi:hypothetical protein|nr:DUF1488 domain-containing protein [Gammaproteobacteria bacterium]MCW8941655.1 DUF1488 domain-containing protein [Gammaproteobacteria bacterium]